MRPEGFKVPYRFVPTPELIEIGLIMDTDLGHFLVNDAFEAGADAMLEGLKEGYSITIEYIRTGLDINGQTIQEALGDIMNRKGYLVFIEEE